MPFWTFFSRAAKNSSLRNKRPGLSGRPPCKGVAIGVARRGGRLGGERTLRVPSSCSFPVSHSGGPHVVSFVAGRRPCARGARVRAGVARRATESLRASWRGKSCRKKEEEKVPAKEGQRTKVQDKKESCARAEGLGSTMAAASLCVRAAEALPCRGPHQQGSKLGFGGVGGV